jgi:polyisoprenoid-binding protein YceI
MKSGVVQYDSASGAARGDIVIDAASGDSGSHARDTRMKKSILQVAQFPEVHFLPQRVSGTVPAQGSGHFQVQGICQLHGSEHPLTLDLSGSVTGSTFSGTTHFAIPYVQWGLKDPSTLFLRVSKQVIVDVTTAGTFTRPRT